MNIYGWNEGFQKVNTTKLLQKSIGYSLSKSLDLVCKILNGEHVNFEFDTAKIAYEFKNIVNTYGVIAEVIDD